MLTRRAFMTGGLTLVAGARLAHTAVQRTPRFGSSPFALGVASGDPAPDGVVLWTRLAPEPLNDGGMSPEPVEVAWEVASDDRMQHIVTRGIGVARPEAAHSVHVEVDGLAPDRWYWYRFRAGGELSPTGRTRTLPASKAAADRLRLAFASCQNFEMGYFTAYQHLANEDLQLVLHLGDYIYEGRPRDGFPRRHSGPEPTTLQEYRNRYAQYKSDADLQAAHAAFPWIVTWDDHEVDNDYAATISERRDPVEEFVQRRSAAYQAYYEHMPLRAASRLRGLDLKLYRGFSCGTLASLFVLDTRQYRSIQPCGQRFGPLCDEARDHRASILGGPQERWLFDGLTRSTAAWNLIPQQVIMAAIDWGAGAEERFATDHWSGYDASRTRLCELFASTRARNPVVLTGDVHSNLVNDLKVDFRDSRSPAVATELVGTSISSGGDGVDQPESVKPVLAENEFIRFFNGQRGYVVCNITRKALAADFRTLEYVSRTGAPITTRASFVIEDGRPGARRVTG
jgi:alkaline phosphatase D